MRHLFRLLLLLLPLAAAAQSSLPPCPAYGIKTKCFGTQVLPSGASYTGEFYDDKFSGRGRLIYVTGGEYFGEWLLGQRSGKGIEYRPNGEINEVGIYRFNRLREVHPVDPNEFPFSRSIKNSKIPSSATHPIVDPPLCPVNLPKDNCFGEVLFGDGPVDKRERYVGDFRGNKFNGRGSFTDWTGKRYVGFFKNGQREGLGILYLSNGQVQSSGYWEGGVLRDSSPVAQSLFPFSFPDQIPVVRPTIDGPQKSDNLSSTPTSTQVVAAIIEDDQPVLPDCVEGKAKLNCWGESRYPNGDRYIGEFRDEIRHGQGIEYLKWSGKKYIGEWRDGRLNGKAIIVASNGEIEFTGIFKDGVLVLSHEVDKSRFPFRRPMATMAEVDVGGPAGAKTQELGQDKFKTLNRDQADRDRLAAEVEAERKKRQEAEEQLVRERERVAAISASSQRPSQLTVNRTERRVALIFGNSAYRSSPLVNPVNDASDLDATLRGLGFKTTLVKDATIAQMRNATRQFADEAAFSDVALIFFAGHGVEAKGRNYLIPVSADIKHEYELEDQAYDAGRWLDMLESMKSGNKQRVNIVIIDACRNNDLSRGWRSASRGLARMDAPTGTFVAFATAPGKVAMDGAKGQRNSPFTKNLLRAIQTPDMPIELMFKEVRRLVLEETKNEQVPWDNSSLVGDFVFKRTR